MVCCYPEELVDTFDGMDNSIGPECSNCSDCECEHWSGTCPEDCEFMGDPGRCPGKWETRDPYEENPVILRPTSEGAY